MRKIKQGDDVYILAGKDRGKEGKIIRMAADRVVVENVNLVKRHTKGTAQGAAGSIREKEMPIHISNIALINPVSNKPDRVGFKFLEDGKKVRYFKSNGEVIDTV
ncbi:MAG: 50S ribosomal protein L24 [Gammaproteobacteria bacterium]|nr:50S ribosomal protein L24 [Gammaproteobacteria bacterium]